MDIRAADAIARLVQPDRVHHSVYSDPAVFDLEMARIFGHAWLLLGHESQVREPGAYFTTRMGREPVIVARHADGSIRVLVNRCAHRGAMVCPEGKGTTKQFVCPYHGWSYATDGRLHFIPIAQGYGPDAERRMSELGLSRVPRVESYRGFVFASLLDRPLVPPTMLVLWLAGIIPGTLALAFALIDGSSFLWTLSAWRAEARAGSPAAAARPG